MSEKGVHTFRQTTTDYAGNIAHSATWTVEVRLEHVVHANVYFDDPSTDPIAVSEDWAQLGTLIGRSVEEDAISTRDDVVCPSGTCAELRQRHLAGSGTPANDDGFVRYRGTSSTDTRIGVATDMIQLGLVSLGDTPTSTGSTSNVVFPWQVLPPGAGTTYEVYESTGSIEDGGTATDGANGEEDSQTERQVRVRLVLDATTKLPLRQTSFAVDDNELLSRRIWAYDPNVLFRRDLAADFFDVPRPTAPGFEKVVEYTEPAAPLAARQDAATGKAYEPARLASPVRLSRGRMCEVSRMNIAHTERPLPNEIPADNGRSGEIYRSTRTITTFGALTKAGRCPKAADPVLTIESAALASPLAAAWRDGYIDLGTAMKKSAGSAATKRSVQDVEIGGKTQSVPVLALGADRRGAYPRDARYLPHRRLHSAGALQGGRPRRPRRLVLRRCVHGGRSRRPQGSAHFIFYGGSADQTAYTRARIEQHMVDDWDTSAVGGRHWRKDTDITSVCKVDQRLYWLNESLTATTSDKSDWHGSTSRTRACTSQTHARFWDDQEHARFTTGHGQEDQWVVGGIHHEHPIPKLRCVDIVCTFKGTTHRIDRDWDEMRYMMVRAMNAHLVGFCCAKRRSCGAPYSVATRGRERLSGRRLSALDGERETQLASSAHANAHGGLRTQQSRAPHQSTADPPRRSRGSTSRKSTA